MSQAGPLNESGNPAVPTSFVTDAGTAVPAANTLNILGGTEITTTGAGNTVVINFTGGSVTTSLTGNSGGAVSPLAGNINTVGTGSITVVGNPGTHTLTAQLQNLTNHNVLVGAGTATITNVPPSTAGFVLTSNGAGSDPSFQSASASGAITTITGNSGGAEGPLLGNFNILGTGSITVVGSANTETVQLTGLTNHAIQIGAGTATLTQLAATATTGQVLQNNAGADPSYSTATYPSTTTINQILYSSSANVVAGLATANRAVLTTGTTGVPVLTALATDGQVIIGSTAGVPAAATLSAGTGISITNGSNTITIASSGTTNLTVTPVNHGASPYTVLITDDFLAVDTSGGVVTVKLPNAPATGKVYIVKDSKGTAVASNISVTTVGGVVTIDGQTTYTMATNYQSIQVIFDGTSYEVY